MRVSLEDCLKKVDEFEKMNLNEQSALIKIVHEEHSDAIATEYGLNPLATYAVAKMVMLRIKSACLKTNALTQKEIDIVDKNLITMYSEVQND